MEQLIFHAYPKSTCNSASDMVASNIRAHYEIQKDEVQQNPERTGLRGKGQAVGLAGKVWRQRVRLLKVQARQLLPTPQET